LLKTEMLNRFASHEMLQKSTKEPSTAPMERHPDEEALSAVNMGGRASLAVYSRK